MTSHLLLTHDCVEMATDDINLIHSHKYIVDDQLEIIYSRIKIADAHIDLVDAQFIFIHDWSSVILQWL